MKRTLRLAQVFLVVLCVASFSLTKEKETNSSPLSGTWECMSHGSSRGDVPFTLQLARDNDYVTGSVTWPSGGAQIYSGTFRNNELEIHLDTPQGESLLTAKLEKGKLTGEWSSESGHGTWEGKKQTQTIKQWQKVAL